MRVTEFDEYTRGSVGSLPSYAYSGAPTIWSDFTRGVQAHFKSFNEALGNIGTILGDVISAPGRIFSDLINSPWKILLIIGVVLIGLLLALAIGWKLISKFLSDNPEIVRMAVI